MSTSGSRQRIQRSEAEKTKSPWIFAVGFYKDLNFYRFLRICFTLEAFTVTLVRSSVTAACAGDGFDSRSEWLASVCQGHVGDT